MTHTHIYNSLYINLRMNSSFIAHKKKIILKVNFFLCKCKLIKTQNRYYDLCKKFKI